MWKSPHRKVKIAALTADIKLPIGKRAPATGSGDSGKRYKKKHVRAQQPPGNPRGVCNHDRDTSCRCGKHNA